MEQEKKGVRNFRISTTQGMSGHFAVKLADYEDMDWNTDVVQSGVGRYKTKVDAEKEALSWANEEKIPFVVR